MHVHAEFEASKACKQSSWGRQFGAPTGWRGHAVGHLMALKNAAMSRRAVELLEVEPEDRVLEIGFGPGLGIFDAARRATQSLMRTSVRSLSATPLRRRSPRL